MTQPPRLDRQREHQANERTFLAWVRTSIALISFGLAIARFGLFLRELQQGIMQTQSPSQAVSSQTIGLLLVLAGMVMIVLAAWSYNRAFQQIEQGNYRLNRWIIWITTLVLLLIGGLSLPFVLWQPAPKESSGQTKSQIDRPSPRSSRKTTAQQTFSIAFLRQRNRLSQSRFSGGRRMKLHRHQSLGKRQTVA